MACFSVLMFDLVLLLLAILLFGIILYGYWTLYSYLIDHSVIENELGH